MCVGTKVCVSVRKRVDVCMCIDLGLMQGNGRTAFWRFSWSPDGVYLAGTTFLNQQQKPGLKNI